MIAVYALALFAAAQASVGVEDAQCVLDNLSAAERSALSAAAQADGEPPAAVGAKLESLAVSCAESRGWTRESAGNSVALALSMAIVDDVAAALERGGVDPGIIDAWFERQPQERRTDHVFSDEDGARIVRDLEQAGVPLAVLAPQGERIGAYVAALVMIERIAHGLPID